MAQIFDDRFEHGIMNSKEMKTAESQDQIIDLIRRLYDKASLSQEVQDALCKYQSRIIELLKESADKSPSSKNAIIHSINDTLEDEDVIAMLQSAIDKFGKDDALFQIKRLMETYDISPDDLRHSSFLKK